MSNIYSVLTLFAIIINFAFIITAVFSERKKPVQALSWVVTLLLLPVVGFFLYLLFGIKSYKQYSHKVFTHSNKIPYGNAIKVPEYFNDEMKQLMRLNAATSQSAYTDDNNVLIYTTAQEKYNNLLKDIEEAESSIHVLYFIIQNDYIGQKLISLLARKAAEGVEVRVIIDHGAKVFRPFKPYEQIVKHGGEVYSYFTNTINNYLKINFRNHRKIVVIDGKIGYTGGINIGDEYMGLQKKTSPWRDTHLRMTGSCVLDLQLRFIEDWIYASQKNPDLFDSRKYFPETASIYKGNTGVQIVSSGPDTSGEEIKRGILKMINSAKRRIYIQTPYFVPDTPILQALQDAALAGVEVCIQIPQKPDKRYVYKATMSYVADVLDYGVKVFLYPGFMHAKMLVVDDFCSAIGTANMDIRSFTLNFEIEAFMFGEIVTENCSKIFKEDLAVCKEITQGLFKKRSPIEKIEESIYRLLSPIL